MMRSPDGRERQTQIYLQGLAGRRPTVPTDHHRLEARARAAMSWRGFAYIAGGAGSERTMHANRAAFEQYRIVPRVLRDASQRSMATELFGRRLPTPLLLAPIGVLDMAHPEADLAVARAAAAENIPMIFSNQASVPMECCAEAMGQGERWFQLYWSTSNEVVTSLVRRAEASGCSAIVLTVDTTLLGWRPRDLDLGSLPFLQGQGIAQYASDPVFRAQLRTPLAAPAASAPITPAAAWALLRMTARFPGPFLRNLRSGEPRAAVQRFVATYSRPSLSWNDLAFLRNLTKLPILLKGILHPDDARLAIETGMDGVVVSNHGGRQIDLAVAALDALSGIVAAVDGQVPVVFDSGIRSGADVFVALALGAKAVCIGRPYAYGLAIAGSQGVRDVIANIRAELDLTMGLAGCTSLAEMNRAMIQTFAP